MTITYKRKGSKDKSEKLANFLRSHHLKFQEIQYGSRWRNGWHTVTCYDNGTITVQGGDEPNDYNFYRDVKKVIDSIYGNISV